MPLLPLLLLLLAASASAATFTCTRQSTCESAFGYTVPNATTYEELYSRFQTSSLHDLLRANDLTSSIAIPAQTAVTIPFTCRCTGNGIGQSDQKPIYTVILGDKLYNIAHYNFGGFVTDDEIAIANSVANKSHIEPPWNLWIPLPCSCDKVDGSKVMHFAYSVRKGEHASQIAAKFGVRESRLRRVNNILDDGNNLTMGQILDVPQPQPQPRGLLKLIIGVCLAITALAVLVWLSLSWQRWKRKRDSFARGIDIKRFEYSVLDAATDKFSEEKRLGEGAFGAVYMGCLTDEDGKDQKIAVKKIKSGTGESKDFHAELKAASSTKHVNLVSLKGWGCSTPMMDVMCWSRPQNIKLFLVYELVTNYNLDYHLHKNDEVLPWTKRYQIANGIASALHYLHHQIDPHILHRDIKPSNILLDDQFNPKLADFGLARIANHKSTTAPTQAIGTVGYIDPQCMKDGPVKFSRHTDVYSFGIVLLEIACTDKTREQVLELYSRSEEPQVDAAADSKLDGKFDWEEMKRVVVLGLRCSDPDQNMRPSMIDAKHLLEQGTQVPAIANKEEEQLGVSIPTSADSSSEFPAIIDKEDGKRSVSITVSADSSSELI